MMGRALGLQLKGDRFDSGILHHNILIRIVCDSIFFRVLLIGRYRKT